MAIFQNSWIHSAPSLDELVSEKLDERRGKHETAIVIPTAGGGEILARHLEALGKQKGGDFDIIIVYGKDEQFRKNALPGRILHVREKQSGGCAGAFFIGEKIAYDDGYRFIILSDDDCVPETENLVEEHVKALENADIVLPKEVFYGKARKPGGIIHHYAGVKREVFGKSGFTFLPFNIGGEDLELLERFRRDGHRVASSLTSASHPAFRQVYFQKEPYLYHYQRGVLENRLMHMALVPSLSLTLYNLNIAVLLLLIGDAGRAGVIFRAVWAASGLEFFMREGILGHELSEEKNPKYDFLIQRDGSAVRGISKTAGFILTLPKYLGKTIMLSQSPRYQAFGDLVLALFAKKTMAMKGETAYRVGRERGSALVLAGIIIYILFIPAIFFLGMCLALRGLVIKILSGIDSRGYGTSEKT